MTLYSVNVDVLVMVRRLWRFVRWLQQNIFALRMFCYAVQDMNYKFLSSIRVVYLPIYLLLFSLAIFFLESLVQII